MISRCTLVPKECNPLAKMLNCLLKKLLFKERIASSLESSKLLVDRCQIFTVVRILIFVYLFGVLPLQNLILID